MQQTLTQSNLTKIKNLAKNTQPCTPRDFLRHYNQISGYPLIDIFQIEAKREYQLSTIRILSNVLDVSISTVYGWGGALDFDKMPIDYQLTLGYAVAVASDTNKVHRIKAGEFIRRIFDLAALVEESKLRLVSSKQFRKQSKEILSQVLRVDKAYIETWGSNMYFNHMPSKYEVVLGYAIEAIQTIPVYTAAKVA